MKTKNETFIDLCFIRESKGRFKEEIDDLLRVLFREEHLHWYLEESNRDGAEMVVAEVRGISTWQNEQEILDDLKADEGSAFWDYIQGYRLQVFSEKKGCGSCGKH